MGLDAKIVENVPVRFTLVGQVVNSKNGCDTAEALIRLSGRGQPGQGWGCVPVMGMNDVRLPIPGDSQLQRCPAEKGKTVGVIMCQDHAGGTRIERQRRVKVGIPPQNACRKITACIG